MFNSEVVVESEDDVLEEIGSEFESDEMPAELLLDSESEVLDIDVFLENPSPIIKKSVDFYIT